MEDLERFVITHDALTIKPDHQLGADHLGYSEWAKFFGIYDLEEARGYMNHRSLGPRYLKCVAAVMEHQDQLIEDIMGGDVDAKKLKSSLPYDTGDGMMTPTPRKLAALMEYLETIQTDG